MKRRASRCAGVRRNRRRRRALDHAAAMQQHDLAGEPSRLAEIVRRHHDLDAARGDRADDVLDRLGRGGIEARGRLVEKQHLRVARQRAGKRQPLLLAAGQAAAPAARASAARPTSASSSATAPRARARGTPRCVSA